MKKSNVNKDTVWYIKFVVSSALDFKIYELQSGENNTITENDNNIFITLTKQRFENLVNSLVEQNVLSWKDKYENLNDEKKDKWKLKIELYTGEEILKQGINDYPENYKNVLSILKKYGVNIKKENNKEKINIYSDEIDELFDKNMIVRGINYFNNGVVDNLIKDGNNYYSTLKNIDNYHIKININEKNDIISMNCDCPYEGNCKHEYAVLLKIKEENYKNSIKENSNDNLSYNIKENEIEFIINILKDINKVKWKKIKLSEEYKNELIENGFDLDSINIPSVPDYPKELIAFFVYLNKIDFYDDNYLFNVSKIQNNRISDLDIDAIRTFLTYMYKQESSSSGLIARYIENGKLIQLLERLKELL
jgi:uncharacterized protein YqgQ